MVFISSQFTNPLLSTGKKTRNVTAAVRHEINKLSRVSSMVAGTGIVILGLFLDMEDFYSIFWLSGRTLPASAPPDMQVMFNKVVGEKQTRSFAAKNWARRESNPHDREIAGF